MEKKVETEEIVAPPENEALVREALPQVAVIQEVTPPIVESEPAVPEQAVAPEETLTEAVASVDAAEQAVAPDETLAEDVVSAEAPKPVAVEQDAAPEETPEAEQAAAPQEAVEEELVASEQAAVPVVAPEQVVTPEETPAEDIAPEGCRGGRLSASLVPEETQAAELAVVPEPAAVEQTAPPEDTPAEVPEPIAPEQTAPSQETQTPPITPVLPVALIEAILYLESDLVDEERLARISTLPVEAVRAALEKLEDKYTREESGVELARLGGGVMLSPKRGCWERLKERYGKKSESRLSRAAMETLSIIAYSQPITRSEVEAIRGVQADNMIRLLLEKELIREVGKKDVPGKPVQFGTTKEFLKLFRIQSIADLPKLNESEADRFELHG
jgi:segregation and condensation protein B